jgi:type VI protein secretion system component VasK
MSFWDVVWIFIVSFFFVAYLMVLFAIFGDLFRDKDTGGFAKAVWIIALILIPYLSALIYVVVRGRGMAERSAERAVADRQQADAYIRDVAGSSAPSSADQIAKAQKLLADGSITQPEYDRLKEKALA